MAYDVRFTRARGSDVTGRTKDLGPGGMRVSTSRPLRVDERLTFAVELDDGTRVAGRAHVVREHGATVYAVRFDRVDEAADERLWALCE